MSDVFCLGPRHALAGLLPPHALLATLLQGPRVLCMDARHVQRSLPLLAEQLGLARATEVMVRNPLVLAAPMASLQVHVPVLVELLGQDGVGDVLANANIKQLLREFSADESTSGPRQVRVSAARERERERERTW